MSPPGALSKRTDGSPAKKAADAVKSGGAGHRVGGSRGLNRLLSAAPMPPKDTLPPPPTPDNIAQAAQNGQGQSPQAAPPPAMQPPLPLGAGTALPDEPVTAGAPLGAGPNSIPGLMSMNPGMPYKTAADQLTIMAQSTGNPDLAYLAGLAGNGSF